MHDIRVRLAALVIALAVAALAPLAALAHGHPAGGDYAAIHGPLVTFHRAATPARPAPGEPRAVYGMITLSYFEVIASEQPLDWETIRFLEMNIWEPTPEFAYVPAPQG